MRLIIIATIFGWALSFAGQVGSAQISDRCADIQTSAQIDECVALQNRAADRALNNVYKQLIKKIDAAYKNEPKLKKNLLDAIAKAQRLWIKFRDANCMVEAFEIEPGQRAHTTAIYACQTKMTYERTGELRTLLGK